MKRGDLLRVLPDGEVFRLVGWKDNIIEIAWIQRMNAVDITEPGKGRPLVDLVIVNFADGEVNPNLKVVTEEEALQEPHTSCIMCGYSLCECYSLYKFCPSCQRFCPEESATGARHCTACSRSGLKYLDDAVCTSTRIKTYMENKKC